MNRWRSSFYLCALTVKSRAHSDHSIAFLKYSSVALRVSLSLSLSIPLWICKMMQHPSCLNELFQKYTYKRSTYLHKSPICSKYKGFIFTQELMPHRLTTERWNKQLYHFLGLPLFWVKKSHKQMKRGKIVKASICYVLTRLATKVKM